ncbi:hypothetical protein L3i22_093270 [Actinoplanes sp. L3-i22]|nr:hypothetical protein L3i22_093270 [Actinoplanes sp. L3-i22]
MLTTTSSCQPVPQSDTVRRVAVAAAADAGSAIQAVPTAATVASEASNNVLFRRIDNRLRGKVDGAFIM